MYSNKISHAPNAARGHILTQAKYLEIHRIQFYFTGGGLHYYVCGVLRQSANANQTVRLVDMTFT